MLELAAIAEASRAKPETIVPVPSLNTIRSSLPEIDPVQGPSILPSPKAEKPSAEMPLDNLYRVYTSEFDEVIPASQLAGDPKEAIQLQTELAGEIASIKRRHLTFFQSIQTTTNQQDIAITLLLDNSGSLRGYRIRSMAAWATILSEWFEI